MYGTVSRYRLKPGTEAQALALANELDTNPSPGYVGAYMFRLDAGNDEYISVGVWSDRDMYRKSAEDERQQQWFARFRELMAGDPEWNDGEVIWAPRR
ncbi:MAG TPA: antibiotic biosynthesis monooxygenase [Dehalococcoidia bacterium]|nr:antibiotic biosynthesis monooxygenase [Dehalococcoidia bacterium]